MISFSTIVDNLIASSNGLTAVNTTDFGSIDKLDANQQNAVFPYVFFRPLTSAGVPVGDVMVGSRQLNFEMYVMDIPYQTDSDIKSVMSSCEQIGYDILSAFYDGIYNPTIKVNVSSIVPLFEAFQDRVAGWVFNITIETSAQGLTSCNRV